MNLVALNVQEITRKMIEIKYSVIYQKADLTIVIETKRKGRGREKTKDYLYSIYGQ